MGSARAISGGWADICAGQISERRAERVGREVHGTAQTAFRNRRL